VSEAWVVNASPLILLARVDRLELLQRLAPDILVPDAVIAEIRAGQHKDLTAAKALDWTQTYRVQDFPPVASVERWDLGAGESQVIAHCIGRSRWAVLDDLAARRCAAAHNVRTIGTLGVILRAKQLQQIERARPVVDALRVAGMFLDDKFMNDVLALVGE
jgi:predicted nucleic acid-binding protein